MADRKISELDQLAGADARGVDELAINHRSGAKTHKITLKDLAEAGYRESADGSIPIEKVDLQPNSIDGNVIKNDSITATQLGPNSVGSSELADDAVDEDAIQNGAVTNDKVADDINASKLLDGSITTDKIGNQQVTAGKIADATITGDKIAAGTIEGSNIANNTIGADQIASNSITADELADGAVDTAAIQNDAVTGAKLSSDAFNRGLDKDADDKVGITNEITPGSHAGITYDEQGLITDVSSPIPSSDLPIATDVTVGAVSIPTDGGLTVNGAGEVRINNNVAPDTNYKITYNDHGLVTASGPIEADDLPIATDSTLGAIMVPDIDADGDESPLSVNGTGALVHDDSGVAPGSYPKVTVDKYGHVTAGGTLDATDIPEISADLITSGEIGSDQLAECSVTGPKICDYATCLMQEDNPGQGDFLGQFWYTPSTAQLRVYARGSGPENIWLPVGFGALQANNLRWGGTYDADTDTLVSLTSIGVSEGLTAGQSFPAPSDALSGIYFICQVAGNNCVQPNINNINHTAGDWALCLDGTQGWVHIDANGGSGGGGGGGAQYLDDLLDVTIGGQSGPFSEEPKLTLGANQILKYDGGMGQWRNTDMIDGGSY